MRISITKIFSITSLLITQIALALSPYLPPPRSLYLNTAYTFETANRFWSGRNNMPLQAPIKVRTLWLGFDYGIAENLALDFITGYTNSSNPAATRSNFDGIADSTLGLRWQVVDEDLTAHLPSIALRVAGILHGTYERTSGAGNNLHAPGDKVNAVEGDVIVGKHLPWDFTVTGELSYLQRSSPAPEEYIVAANLIQNITPQFNWNVGLRRVANLYGKDISDSDFTGRSSDFQALREIKNYASAGIGYNTPWGQVIGLNYARVIGNNRNTKDSHLVSLYLTLPLNRGI
ncbi:MAG: hypothetical protein Tsb005_20310 [Gammaproteobacteria bacterium]